MALASCASLSSPRVKYFRQATGQATERDIRNDYGPPDATEVADSAGTKWVYYERIDRPWYLGGNYCVQNLLTFDEQKILRTWSRGGNC
jgi:hypothetical protein